MLCLMLSKRPQTSSEQEPTQQARFDPQEPEEEEEEEVEENAQETEMVSCGPTDLSEEEGLLRPLPSEGEELRLVSPSPLPSELLDDLTQLATLYLELRTFGAQEMFTKEGKLLMLLK